MAHEVEKMFYQDRKAPWHGLGTAVREAPNSAEAIRLAGQDWSVIKRPTIWVPGENDPVPILTAENADERYLIPGKFATIRTSDGRALGIVGKDYQVIQNKDAFDFVDALLGPGNARFDTAGSLRGGQRVWLSVRMPSFTVLGEDSEVIDRYLMFTNTHDGSGRFQGGVAMIRPVCMNTVNLFLASAERLWGTRHTGDLQGKLFEAERALELSEKYQIGFRKEAERLANVGVTSDDFLTILGKVYPIPHDAPVRTANNAARQRDDVEMRYRMSPDLKPFVGTGWGVYNAFSDHFFHRKPTRVTPTYGERLLESAMDGHRMMDKVQGAILELV